MESFLGALLLLGLGITMALMWVLWLIQLRVKNASLAGFGWVLGIVLLAALYAWMGAGWDQRRIIACIMVSIWGLRLGFYLFFTRVIGHSEDGRFQPLRKKWKKEPDRKFLYFFEAQAPLSVLFSIPVLLACFNSQPVLSPLEKASMELWLFAFLGEALADYQLNRFRSDRKNRKKTFRGGLWKYSRHPNYFFEWLVWCANALFTLSSPYGGLALLCPLVMLFLLFKIVIPANETQALRTRGADYRRYQKTTSVFVPWFKKA
jgi:steroid 5-alpha reductase family enzyme